MLGDGRVMVYPPLEQQRLTPPPLIRLGVE
jgi:hypothetical protein